MNKNLHLNILRNKSFKILSFFILSSMFLMPFNVLAERIHVLRGSSLEMLIVENKVTLNFTKKPIRDVLSEINRQTNIDFIINDDDAKIISDITINVKNEVLENVLVNILKDKGYTYKIEDSVIVIIKHNGSNIKKQQQNKRVKINGKVIDDQNNAVIGATIIKKGSNAGAITDDKGAFNIEVSTGDILEASFIGMMDTEYHIKDINQENIIIKMQVEAIDGGEVIVTGIYQRKAESFTGSSSTFKGKDLKTVGGQNILQSLKSLDPSFSILESKDFGSDPNRMPDIEIRGKSSVIGLKEQYGTDPNQPLFILDGFETDLKTIVDLNMDRVESVTILKDAASTAIYGSKAANGVVVIETKSPAKGKFRVTYSGNMYVSTPDLSDYNLMNSTEKLQFEYEAGRYKASTINDQLFLNELYNIHKADIDRGVDTYWMNEPLRTSITQKHNLYADGGDDNIRYGIGVTYNNTNGVMKKSSNDLLGVNFDLMYRKGKLSISNKLNFDYYSQEDPTVIFSEYTKANPYYKKTNDEGEIDRYLEYYKTANNTVFAVTNPLYNASLNSFHKSDRINFENKLNVEFKVFNELVLRGRLSLMKTANSGDKFTSPSDPIYDNKQYNQKGSYQKSNGGDFIYNGDITLSYGKVFNDIHQVNAVIGSSMRSSNSKNGINTYIGFPIGDFNTPSFSSGYAEASKPTYSDIISRSNSFYMNGGYTYSNRYLLDVNFRFDGASIFGSNKRYTETWAIGIGWNLHNETFMRNMDWLSRLKIRASVGNPGNQNFDAYQSFTTYRFNNDYQNPYGTSVIIDGFGNEDLKWQKTIDTNIGFDLSMLNNRFNINLDYYIKDTNPLLAQISVPSSVGKKTIFTNVGGQIGRGISGTIKYSPIYRPQDMINWTLSLNFKHQTAEYKNIGNSLEQFNTENRNSSLVRYYDGGSPTSLWAVRSLGINPADGNELFLKKDGSYTSTHNVEDEVMIGNSEPKLEGVIGSTLYYKGFSFSMHFRYSLGADVFTESTYKKVENISMENVKYNQDKRALYDRWRKVGDKASFKSISLTNETPMSSRFVLKENYIKAESISIGYDFNSPELNRIGIQSLRVQANTSDLFRISSIKEERGIEYPFARQFSLSLSLTF